MRKICQIIVSCFCLILFTNDTRAANKAVASVIKSLFETSAVETGFKSLDGRLQELKVFYQTRSYKPLWVRDNGPKGKAKALLSELNRSIVHGLEPGFYKVSELADLMGATSPDKLAKLELLFNGALVEYSHDLANGRVDQKTAPNQNHSIPIVRSITEIIKGAETAGNLRTFISSLLNVDDRYVRLISKVTEMKRASASKLWPKFSDEIPELALGDNHPELLKIRKYLILTGDLLVVQGFDNANFDRPLHQAVLSFQTRYGLSQSGKLDVATLREMTLSIEKQIERIDINLERRRWQNRDIGKNHLYLNIADNSARLVRDHKKIDELRLIPDTSYGDIPTLYGRISKIVKSKSGDGIGLIITPDTTNDTSKIEYLVHLKGDPEQLVTKITNDRSFFQKIAAANSDGENLGVELLEPMRVFVTYVTAWANKDGSIHFRPDRLDRDEIVGRALSPK